MSSHRFDELSESEEMYLITLARLSEGEGDGPVPLSTLAQELGIMPVSVNQMIHRLAEAGLVHYAPYKGGELTQAGRRAALRVLRCRRLWEVFLVEHLHLSLVEADALACRMEHITPDNVVERLSTFLDDPAVSPQGKPIPRSNVGEPTLPCLTLSQLRAGQRGQVLEVSVQDAITRAFLAGEGVCPGAELVVLALGNDSSVLLAVGDRSTHLSGEVAQAVLVNPLLRAQPALNTVKG